MIHQKHKKSLEEITNDLCPVLSVQQLYRISTMYWDDRYNTETVSHEVCLLSLTPQLPVSCFGGQAYIAMSSFLRMTCGRHCEASEAREAAVGTVEVLLQDGNNVKHGRSGQQVAGAEVHEAAGERVAMESETDVRTSRPITAT